MNEIISLILSAGFGIVLVCLFGENGFTIDSRSRRGRKVPVSGGRRQIDSLR